MVLEKESKLDDWGRSNEGHELGCLTCNRPITTLPVTTPPESVVVGRRLVLLSSTTYVLRGTSLLGVSTESRYL